ncbi:type II toxin-antitoxin system RelE/ParE family toxin [Fulvivirgaceae bacterium BMA12]|uniref:Type II toxin-antitoxin system RelE/ParE family toxin n=1 Tax=Agaribacillus aureus TaxID=3051825 RepID=A0ABT8L4Y2_9BACT|nr:type II toxin-antitoxin system RelE/ParE family toxin [Fulvivirgaceae bacterium BMA12]
MPKFKRFYELSAEADQDIDAIFDYTEIEFGFDQAVKYVSEFEDFFEQLLHNDELGKKRDEIKAGLRSFPKSRTHYLLSHSE